MEMGTGIGRDTQIHHLPLDPESPRPFHFLQVTGGRLSPVVSFGKAIAPLGQLSLQRRLRVCAAARGGREGARVQRHDLFTLSSIPLRPGR